jgi:adenylate cyclase
METVLGLDPKPPAQVHDYYALALFMNGREAEALAILQENPVPAKSDLRLEMLASSNARLGQGDAAKAAVDELVSIFPGTSLDWYRVLLRHQANAADRKARLDVLALAGLPDWPFGFEGNPARRLDAAAIEELTARRTWSGELDRQEPFVEYHQDGGFIHRRADYQFTGSYRVEKNELCLEAPGVLMGREHCGPIYRNPDEAGEGAATYSYPTAYGLRLFSVDR